MVSKNLSSIPIAITSLRLILLPFLIIYWDKYGTIIWILIGLSDILDGASARTLNAKTEFGAFFDKFSDFIVLIVSFIFFISRINTFLAIALGILSIFFVIKHVKPMIKNKRLVSGPFGKPLSLVAFLTILISLLKLPYEPLLALLILLIYLNTIAIYKENITSSA